MSSNFRLQVTNLLIGMCRGTPGLSGELRGLGYREQWIARGFPRNVESGSHPVLVLASRAMRHSLFVELAPEPQISPERLLRYTRTTAVELRRGTNLAREQTETYGVAVFGLAEHRDTLRASIEESGVRAALLLCDPEGIRLDANPFIQAALTNIFRPMLPIDWLAVPRWIPFDHESGQADIAGAVIPDVVARFLAGETRLDIGDICRRQILWDLTTETGRTRLRVSVRKVLVEAANLEMRKYFLVRGRFVEAASLGRDDGMPIEHRTLRIVSQRQEQLLARLGADGPGPVAGGLEAVVQPEESPEPDSSSDRIQASSAGS